jgi:hypothetical protein
LLLSITMIVKMPKMDSKLRWLLLVIIPVFLFVACKDEAEPMAFDKSLLINKWYLESGIVTEQGQTRALIIDTCKLDDFIELKAENKLVFFFGTQKCNSSEPDALFRFWHVIDGQLDLDKILYEVISVTTDSMNLRRTLVSGLGEYTTIEYYYLN